MDHRHISVIKNQDSASASKELVDTNVTNVQEDGWVKLHIALHVVNASTIGMTF